jgi:ribosomal protein S18 acetylase RimI-like enzyme
VDAFDRPQTAPVLDAGEDLVMVLDDLTRVPSSPMPPGYSVRAFEDGDDESWARIQAAADLYNVITPDLFASQFGTSRADLEQRQLYAVDERGRVVGAVSAWFPEAEVEPDLGRLHWLAVIPDHQRHGLGAALIAEALERMHELGYKRAYLTTSAARGDALRLYERFGFRPVAYDDLLA